MLNVFLLIELTAETSLLSTYSTSGLLKESQVDIVSSKETEKSSDLLGDISILHGAGAGTAAMAGTASSLLEREVTLEGTLKLGLTFEDVGKLFVEIPTLLVQARGPFFTLAILVVHGTFTCQKKKKSHVSTLKNAYDI